MANEGSVSRKTDHDRRPSVGSSNQSKGVSFSAGSLPQVAILVLFGFAIWLGLAPLSAVPDVVPAGAPATGFSAERAMADLRLIAAEPRPIGSPANAAVRDYLMSQISALGLEPQVQSAHVIRHSPGFPETHLIAVENVLVRVPGTDPTGKALLVSGHYDSVATSTGASDCGTCAVTTLETLRAVAAASAGSPLRNDVIFLFTDGEEMGVAGATGFMRDHPWAADVGLSLVFEGLGSDGAPLLYITGPESGAIAAGALGALGEDSSFPLASSFLHDFMWAVSGNTGSDLDAFVQDAPGLGFIYLSLDTVASYHTTADNLANLDPRSLQGMGDFALAMNRYFGDQPLDDLPRSPNLVMFPLWPGMVARYSTAAALPLAAVVAVLLLAVLVTGLRRRELTGKGLLIGFVAWLLSLLATVVAVSIAWWLVRWATPALHNFTVGGWWGSGFYLAASLAMTLAFAVGLYVLWRRRFDGADLMGGGLIGWAILALLTAATLPGMSYLYLWPLLILAVGWLAAGLLPDRDWRRALPFVAASACSLLLFAPVAYWLWIYVGRAEAMMGPPMAGLPVVFVGPAIFLVVASLERVFAGHVPISRQSTSARRWTVIGVVALLISAALFIVPALFRPSPQKPWANTIVYTVDIDRSMAHWVTFNDSRAGRGVRHQLDDWTRQFFATGVEPTTFDPWLLTRSDTPYPALQSVAPVVDLPRTTLTAVDRELSESGHIRLVMDRPAEAALTRLVVQTAAPLTGVTLDGEVLDLAGTRPLTYTILIVGREDEITLDLATAGDGVVTANLLDRLIVDPVSLANSSGLSVASRPAWMAVAAASDTGDGALVTATYTFKE